jgi:hypothetical protein
MPRAGDRVKRNRLHSLCPYFAMFPETFVQEQVDAYTKPSDLVFDPFSGRGTTLLQSLLMGRRAIASDINPVAYCISGAKGSVPKLSDVLHRLDVLECDFDPTSWQKSAAALPEFFIHAYCPATLSQVIFLRATLAWRRTTVDRFIAALVLGSLHGEMDKSSSYFSNQMPRTISTKPDYSVRYWREHKLSAPQRDVFDLLRKRADYRLSADTPSMKGSVALTDARQSSAAFPRYKKQVNLIVTSPPYLDVTRYEEDQWLRLWFLGHEPFPTYSKVSSDDRHTAPTKYWAFLNSVWKGLADMLSPKCVMICRIGAKHLSLDALNAGLLNSLSTVFSGVRVLRPAVVSNIRNRQTEYFHPGTAGCLSEIDLAFQLTV